MFSTQTFTRLFQPLSGLCWICRGLRTWTAWDSGPLRAYVSAKSSGCKLELVNIGKRIRELLDLTNMWSVFSTIGEHNVKL